MATSNLHTSLLLLLIIIILFIFSSLAIRSPDHPFLQSGFLKVPNSVFATSIQSLLNSLKNVTSVATRYSLNNDVSLSMAIGDCLQLLDSSSDALIDSLSLIQNPTGSNYNVMGTGDLSSDIRTWLSGAITYQDACIEGFDIGINNNNIAKKLVTRKLNLMKPLIQQLLSQVNPTPINFKASKFPPWISDKDSQLIQSSSYSTVIPNVTVALDGTGDYTNVSDAILAAPKHSNLSRYIIYVKKGVYKENVVIQKNQWNILLIGDGIDKTIISGNKNRVDEKNLQTFKTATFSVMGKKFMARDITFENTAGPAKHQAVALHSQSDLSVFFRCKMTGYQDTLFPHTERQFYRECVISGTVDFIFGRGSVVFQNCTILARQGLNKQKNTITAQGRKNASCPSGFIIQSCNITADTDLLQSLNTTKTYLGRPWNSYSRTIVMQSNLSDIIHPEGWLPWNESLPYIDTLYYAEYSNYGPGSGVSGRVGWTGFHLLNSSDHASEFTVSHFIAGDSWLPDTGVVYASGLDV